MKFKGHQKSSFIDYPDKISTVLFTGGCNFRCPYCHNSELVNNLEEDILEEYVFDFLRKRKKMLDAVCISGGEPTMNDDLYDFIIRVKELGYLVKIDTNGTNPNMIRRLIKDNLLDYIAMDIKAPLKKYKDITILNVDIDAIKESINIIINSDVNYEFRTTICRELLSKQDIRDMAEYLKGSKKYVLQNFTDTDTVLIGRDQLHPYDVIELEELGKEIESYFDAFMIR